MESNGKASQISGSKAESKAESKANSFNWTDSQVLSLMTVLKEFHQRFGYSQQYDWAVVNKDFLSTTGIDLTKFGKYVARNKVEHMKKLWKVWSELRFKVTGAGWDQTTGMVTMEESVWDSFKKSKQKGFLHFRTKGVDPELCRLWDDVFGNTTATGKNVMSPSMSKCAPTRSLPAPTPPTMNLDEDDVEGYRVTEATEPDETVQRITAPDGTDLDSLMDQELVDDIASLKELVGRVGYDAPYEVCMDSIRETLTSPIGSSSKEKKVKKKAYSFEIDVVAREARKRRRQSASDAFNEHMQVVGETGKKIVSLMEGECNSTVNMDPTVRYDFGTCFDVVQKMAQEKTIEVGGKLWCFSVSKLCEEPAREAFMKMTDDFMRVSWLQYEYDTTHKVYKP